jgi:hypothetical protein
VAGAAVSVNVDHGLPERLSARQGDAHFDKKAEQLSERIDVLLNGKLLGEVASYDVPEGLITRQLRDKHGKPILDEAGRPAFELLRGVIEVRWVKSEAPPK